MLNSETTLPEFITQVRASFEASDRRNSAIKSHLAKLEKMAPADWATHRASILARREVAGPTIKRIAANLVKKAVRS